MMEGDAGQQDAECGQDYTDDELVSASFFELFVVAHNGEINVEGEAHNTECGQDWIPDPGACLEDGVFAVGEPTDSDYVKFREQEECRGAEEDEVALEIFAPASGDVYFAAYQDRQYQRAAQAVDGIWMKKVRCGFRHWRYLGQDISPQSRERRKRQRMIFA